MLILSGLRFWLKRLVYIFNQKIYFLSAVKTIIENHFNWSNSPDRADILWAPGRLLHCPQIKARAGKWLIKMPEPVAAENYVEMGCFLFNILFNIQIKIKIIITGINAK